MSDKNTTNLSYLSIRQAHDLLVEGKLTASELTKYYLARLAEIDPKIQAVLARVDEAAVLKRAADIDTQITAKRKTGHPEKIHLLEGIPYTAKDMFLTRGTATTAASKILEGFMPPYSATVIDRLEAVGAILLAKVNQDEFGHGGSTENSAYHPTHNPHDLKRVPGGSSGGSAAVVAADVGLFSLGTDTGGSIRQPAAFCGVVGLKPTYGVVSRYGVVAMASSLDCIGPIARSADDASIVLEAIAGRDPHDATTIEVDDYQFSRSTSPDGLKGRKIGLIAEYLEGLDDTNRAVFEEDVEFLRAHGAEVSTVSLPSLKLALAAYYVLTPSEISSNLSRYDGIRYGHSAQATAADLTQTYLQSRAEGFGAEAKRRIMIGTYALSAGYYEAYYQKAMRVRTLICQDFMQAFEQVDVLIGPTTPAPAFALGSENHDPVTMYLNDIMTVAANLAGVPAISMPAGEIEGLPVGLQIMAAQRGEHELLAVARAFESEAEESGAESPHVSTARPEL